MSERVCSLHILCVSDSRYNTTKCYVEQESSTTLVSIDAIVLIYWIYSEFIYHLSELHFLFLDLFRTWLWDWMPRGRRLRITCVTLYPSCWIKQWPLMIRWESFFFTSYIKQVCSICYEGRGRWVEVRISVGRMVHVQSYNLLFTLIKLLLWEFLT